MLIGLAFVDERAVQWQPEFLVAWLWTALAISIGAVSVLYIMIRRTEVSRVASVFFLMPVSAAILAFLLFGQTLTTTAIVGIAVTALGVFMARKP